MHPKSHFFYLSLICCKLGDNFHLDPDTNKGQMSLLDPRYLLQYSINDEFPPSLVTNTAATPTTSTTTTSFITTANEANFSNITDQNDQIEVRQKTKIH